MSFNTFYLNSENQSGIIDGSNVVVGGKMGVSIDPPQYTLDVSGTTRSTNLLATTATITNLDISGDTVDITSLQTKVENTQTVSLSVVVASKTSNAANSGGSSSGYFINNIETPYIHLTAGKTYRFDQSDSTNSSHPILFYLDEGKTSQYSTGITTSGTAGSSGAYVEIAVTTNTPTILYYQCQNHAYMGGTIYVKGTNVTSITSVGTLTAGTWNASTIQKQYIDTQSISINDLSNVVYTASSMTEGQTLVWNPTGQTWVPGTIALETLPSSIYLNGGKSKVMEKIAGVCDGRTISGEMTNYTLQSVSTYQDISTTLVDVEGSSITYSPPSNASQVVYTFAFNIVDISNQASMFNQSNDLTVRFYIDGTEVTNQTAQISSYLYNNGSTYTYTAILDIGNVSSNDISNGKLASWSTGKTLKLMASNSEADYPIRIFAIKTLSSNQYISEFIPPTLQVSSIGNLNTYPFENTTINDLSDVSFNSATTTNGQALVWNSTTQVWEAGVVASSGGGGGGGLTDLSASSISDLSDVSFNSTSTTDGQALVWDATNKIWTPGTVATTSSSSTTSVMSLNPGDFKVLEKIAGVCDGRTISGETAAYTLKNVTAYQDISTTLVDVEGSSISYTPPNNAKQVLYNFRFNVTDISNEANVFNQNHTLTLHLYIDNTEITNQKAQISSYMYNHGHYFNYSAIIDVGSVESDDVEGGKYASWTSSKVITLKAANSHGDYLARLFSIKTVSSGAYIHTFVPPTIEVASVGDVSNISFSTISIADLSDVSFNSATISNNQPLTWNTSTQVWEPSTTMSIDTIQEKTTNNGVIVENVTLNNGSVTVPSDISAHHVYGVNYHVGNKTIVSASAQANFNDLEIKDSINNTTTLLVLGQSEVMELSGTFKTDIIEEKTNNNGVDIESVNIKNGSITAGTNGTISATNFNIGSRNIVSAAAQANFTDLEVKNSITNDVTLLVLGQSGVMELSGTLKTDIIQEKTANNGVDIEGVLLKDSDISANDVSFNNMHVLGDISFNGSLYQNGSLFTGGSTIDETTDVSLNNLIVHGDLSANDASFNVIDATSLRINGVDIIDGAPAALDTLSELAAALDNSANFATNVLTTLSNKQDTLTAGTNITITGTTISASGGGGGLADLSATSINDLSDVSFNSTTTMDGATLSWNTNEQLWKPSSVTNTIGVNMEHNTVTTVHSYLTIAKQVTVANTVSSSTEITQMEISITPKYDDSVINLQYMLNYEGYSNTVFRIVRTVGSTNTVLSPDGGDESGIATVPFDTHNSTTPHTNSIQIYDEPNTTSQVTYKLYIHLNQETDPGYDDFILNGSLLQSNSYAEKLISTVAAIEHPKTKTLVPATSITKQGQVLETLAGVCDGRTVVVESGSYTLPNVTTTFEMTDGSSYVDLPNSSFSYKPPTGTSQVIYRFKINITSLDAHGIANFKLYIDNTEVTNFVRSWTGKGPDEDTLILDYTFEIGQANDITNGKFLTWNTTKNIKIKVREYSSSGHEVKFYSRGYWEGSYQYGTDGFVCPSLEIIAIGESSGQAVTLTNNSVNDLSDISFNSSSTTDGQALVWNSTDAVWEAGAVASSGGVSSGDDISFNNLDISGVLATNKSNNEIKLGAHIIPTTNSTYDLGSAEYKIRHLFLSSNSLWVGEDHKIEISDGKMRFRKLQKDALPSGLSAIPEASLEDAVAVLGKTPGSNASAFSLSDWEAYSKAKGNPLKIDEIFLPDDINDDDGLTDTINSTDISFNVVDASGLNVFGTASMQSIIPPITNTYTLGDPSHVWKDVYIGPGSLYIDGQKVLESDANTIVVGADENQNLKLNTTGTGVLQIESAAGIQISSTGAGNIELGSTGTGIVRITDNLALNGNVEIFNDSSDMVKINDSLMVTGDISFNGNLYQNGVLFQSGGGGGGLTDLSATSIGDLSDVSFNSTTTTDGATLSWDISEQLWKPSSVTNTIGVNMVTTYFSTYQTVTIPTALPGYHVSELDLTIKPMYNDSIIEIKFNVYGDFDENACFRIKRNNDFVVPTTDKSTNALVTAIYDNNDANTPTINLVRWYDTPNTTDSITYKLYINRAHTSSITSYINGTASNVNDWEEQGISTASVIEHPKTKTLVPATSITKQGQVLEILYGRCDGSTVEVESGTYTMPSLPSHRSDGTNNVSTTTYTKDEASEITYTAPPGTDRIEFKFTEYLHSDNTSWIMLYILCIDDVEISKTETLERPGMYAVGAYNLTATITSNDTDLTQSHKYYFKLKHGATHPFKYGPLEEVTPIWGLQSNDGFIPKLKITAIGESSGQAVTLTNNSVNDLSDISFNSTTTTDGQALVWNSTDGVWEAGNSSSSPWTTSSSDIYYNSGNVGIGTTAPLHTLDLGDIGGNIRLGRDHDGSNTSDNSIGRTSTTGSWISRICFFDDGANDDGIFFTTHQSGVGTNRERMRILGNGNVGIGTTPSYKLHVNGSLFYSSGGLNGSDDRIKHNEQPITNALSTISKLTPKHYFKTGTKMYDASHNFTVDASGNPLDSSGNLLKFKEEYTIETGIIAQEIRAIPELKFAVYGEEYVEETVTTYKKDNSGNDILDESGNKIVESVETQQTPNTLAVDYNSIHCTHIAATKELYQLVESQQTTLEEQQNEIEHLKLVNQDTNTQLNAALTELQTIKHYLGI